MRHPLHQEHQIEAIDPKTIYIEYNGEWQCDNCSSQYGSQEIPYHCKDCGYDLCNTCVQPKRHLRHSHDLYLAKMIIVYPHFQGHFKCDACEQNKGETIEDALAYHCFDDQFDLCKECFHGKKFVIHVHDLMPVNAALVYENSPGLWVCDTCKKTGVQMNTNYSWHCSQCEFDCCKNCLKSVTVSDHEHPLKRSDPFVVYSSYAGHWKCDKCAYDYSPGARSENKPYHCFTCGYDMCESCYNEIETDYGYDVTGPPASAFLDHDFGHSKIKSHEPPMEITDDDVPDDNLDDSQKCIVCYGRPKNATIVHGSTGHVCCCLSCAYKLERRGDSCPICRAPIDRVIKHYTS
ncbi:uncharacterized protein LOC100205294 isoform X2 [Hydra vulgaris]|uniref:Uncharacterized protein LOC100205294 isoform X2 n=1 Tax=Hydra vulgaris TaxID=6087 RepID=A0ABM4CVH0_HYDVU